ncbi:CubicO group peptidase (beta-lactamase class C family) [Roseiarcus fermentans]|uniref:CubicO group peptidase (Beta-lactamase class C family) n=1 Tax=Roseiarcus fermentans TaxID=1473586 RepID=A0A366F562_9HYPH|nr:serine hydrolase domain-containing protein [Roseiarcus fermentans]RBP09757.1 CubicO group peptidase (beta-lactamase class C family) [Roseiarcus fermentans]
MQAYVDRGTYAGVSTLIARRGKIVDAGQFGWRDKEAAAPMTADAIFRLYSMTKPIVCTALMTFLEEGRVRLVDPVAAYLPAFGSVKALGDDGALVDPVRPILVSDLMAHTSGLTYHFLDDSPVSRMLADALLFDASASLQEAVDDLARYPLAFQPGTRWHYSVGIDVAARLIEVVSGQPLATVLSERLFEPLGMIDTAFEVPAGKRPRLAAMYGRPDITLPTTTARLALEAWQRGVNDRIDVSATHPVDRPETFVRGGHGLFGTIGDYFRFAQMLANGGALDGTRVIGRKTLELMHANHIPPALLPLEIGGFPLLGYGFGLGSRVAMNVALTAAPGSVGEFGWSGAAKTHYWVDPQEQMVGLFMTQSMLSYDLPELDLRALAYQAIDD